MAESCSLIAQCDEAIDRLGATAHLSKSTIARLHAGVYRTPKDADPVQKFADDILDYIYGKFNRDMEEWHRAMWQHSLMVPPCGPEGCPLMNACYAGAVKFWMEKELSDAR